MASCVHPRNSRDRFRGRIEVATRNDFDLRTTTYHCGSRYCTRSRRSTRWRRSGISTCSMDRTTPSSHAYPFPTDAQISSGWPSADVPIKSGLLRSCGLLICAHCVWQRGGRSSIATMRDSIDGRPPLRCDSGAGELGSGAALPPSSQPTVVSKCLGRPWRPHRSW